MKKILAILLFLPGLSFGQNHQANIKKIYDTELSAGHTYENLRYLCKVVGNRLAGSPGAAASVEWTKQLMESYDFDTVFVDPPRAGIDDETLKLLQGFKRILYISCNPDTLHDNFKILAQTHRIVKFAMFDQFPFTHHVESGVLLEKI